MDDSPSGSPRKPYPEDHLNLALRQKSSSVSSNASPTKLVSPRTLRHVSGSVADANSAPSSASTSAFQTQAVSSKSIDAEIHPKPTMCSGSEMPPGVHVPDYGFIPLDPSLKPIDRRSRLMTKKELGNLVRSILSSTQLQANHILSKAKDDVVKTLATSLKAVSALIGEMSLDDENEKRDLMESGMLSTNMSSGDPSAAYDFVDLEAGLGGPESGIGATGIVRGKKTKKVGHQAMGIDYHLQQAGYLPPAPRSQTGKVVSRND
ncbi:uncharacterized protein PAC_03802 [Phialocephala subalpina]|uniref:Uncharacterized protein n=1 Tax=Phialocephala subalpina TaxID=576137 RepID=A0A1L7WME6_9HELO|nr:uncharacterized protein PAC_03802 [Phialocephala subalpina]